MNDVPSATAQKDGEGLGFWGSGVLGFWGSGVLGFWGSGVLGFWGVFWGSGGSSGLWGLFSCDTQLKIGFGSIPSIMCLNVSGCVWASGAQARKAGFTTRGFCCHANPTSSTRAMVFEEQCACQQWQ